RWPGGGRFRRLTAEPQPCLSACARRVHIGRRVPVGELALRLGVTAHGGLQARDRAGGARLRPAAARAGQPPHARVILTARGRNATDAGRAPRAAVRGEVGGLFGPAGLNRLLTVLGGVAEQSGGLETLSTRRSRPPR